MLALRTQGDSAGKTCHTAANNGTAQGHHHARQTRGQIAAPALPAEGSVGSACACGSAAEGCCAAPGMPGSCMLPLRPLPLRPAARVGSGATLWRSPQPSASLPVMRLGGTCHFGLRSLQHHADHRFRDHAQQAAPAQGAPAAGASERGAGAAASAAGASSDSGAVGQQLGGGARNLAAGLDMDVVGRMTLAEAMQLMQSARSRGSNIGQAAAAAAALAAQQ
uniref:Uncharacterized protein n=1 Tax=Chlamydomonas euryale TaxID=1486919 RepID=A0A6U2IB14_9CHLO|mmetsp:Transcript_41949/g.125558  ORF Transcript_41949/g.125558 Transcript_41949/m.125558 type:complete len:222 (+) Transcript_41949:827-1492(+)